MARTSSLLSLSALAALALTGPASAGPLAPARASDLVTVYTKNATPCPVAGVAFDTIVLADGTEQPFAIPPKRVLVVTSLDWNLTSASPGVAAAPVLGLQTGGASLPLLQGSGVTDSNGTAAGTVTAPTGVVVRSGPQLCLIGGATPAGLIHGFFAKDK